MENLNPIRIFVLITRKMNTKLTLSLEKTIIEQAKFYAKNTGKSLSELIENYLKTLTQEPSNQGISPKLKKIVGAVNLPKNFNEDQELRSYFEQKHLK